ncbi:MAG: right-handed parallel beta-helix repeat-containing protein [Myxococcales bacterium]|nr:right-handed parallel beta-helix repeat-containing protein [Myxococcales bacterium]MCB9641782.1 right-handed parallel beta-helix repeat-containing protein [Myxococcales bacterium]
MRKICQKFGVTLFFVWLWLGVAQVGYAQNCGCDHVIDAATEFVDATKLSKPVMPGQTICLMAGQKNFMRLSNFRGSAAKPLLLKNCGGLVHILNSTRGYGFAIDGSSYFRLTGTGHTGLDYGIKIDGTPQGASGLTLSGKSTDFEVDHIEITRTGFAGIIGKTDPSCDNPDMRSFVMKNVHFHHNLIYKTGGEGFYIGYFAFPTRVVQCSGKDTTLYPHPIEDVSIHHNILRDNGWDGIQLGSAPLRASIHHNIVENYGTANETNQKSGIQLNAGAAADVYNNLINKGTGIGIAVFGYGGNKVYNNVIVRSGEDAIYLNDKTAQSTASYVLANNTIVLPGRYGIGLASANIKGNKIYNNLVVEPGEFATSGQKSFISFLSATANYQLSGNLYVEKVSTAGFLAAAKDDYHLKQTAMAVDAGVDVASLGITTDYDDQPRVNGAKTDVGAFEFRLSTPAEVIVEPSPEKTPPDAVEMTKEPSGPEESTLPSESSSPEQSVEKASNEPLASEKSPQDAGGTEQGSPETQKETNLDASGQKENIQDPGTTGGCGCSSAPSSGEVVFFFLLLFVVFGRRRFVRV